MEDNSQKKENAIEIWKILLGIFVLSYLIWYMNGGPKKWEDKLRESKQSISNNIYLK